MFLSCHKNPQSSLTHLNPSFLEILRIHISCTVLLLPLLVFSSRIHNIFSLGDQIQYQHQHLRAACAYVCVHAQMGGGLFPHSLKSCGRSPRPRKEAFSYKTSIHSLATLQSPFLFNCSLYNPRIAFT